MSKESDDAMRQLFHLLEKQDWPAIAECGAANHIHVDSTLGLALLRACPYLKHRDESYLTLPQFYLALQSGTMSCYTQQLALEHMYPCACCGYLVFTNPSGSYDICNICYWEDDHYQLCNPDQPGANPPLREEQRRFLDPTHREKLITECHCIKPHAGIIKDPHWMSLDDFAIQHPHKNLIKIPDTPTPYYWQQL